MPDVEITIWRMSHVDEEADAVRLLRILFIIEIIRNRLTVLGATAVPSGGITI